MKDYPLLLFILLEMVCLLSKMVCLQRRFKQQMEELCIKPFCADVLDYILDVLLLITVF